MSGSQRVRQAVRDYLESSKGADGLVVAVSGGPDSVALLRALAEQWPETRRNRLVVAHLNHQLRGEAGDCDQAFVADLAVRLGLPFEHSSRDVRGLAESHGENLEATARTVRYAWLESVARSRDISRIATGHTASDQAETVLFRLLRGAGFQGLRGIAGQRELGAGVCVVRPFLAVCRAEVVSFLAELEQETRHDTSNDDDRLRRNRILHRLLPLLASEYNPAIDRVLARLAEQAEEYFLEEEAGAAELLIQAERPRAGATIVLDRGVLKGAARFRVRSMLRAIYRREGWPQDDVPFLMWNRMAGIVFGEETALDVANGVRLEAVGGIVRMIRREVSPSARE